MTMADDPFGDKVAPYEGEIITRNEAAAQLPVSRNDNPFGKAPDERTNAGAVAIESQRASAEVQGRMVIAKRFPRDSMVSYTRALQACQRIGLAECAIYSYSKGQKVEGPSIRLAEELARVWGNLEYGINELSRTPGAGMQPGMSEMEAFAWDLETNTRSSQRFTVAHIRDKSEGGKVLTSERDIYEVTANMGARRVRARILAILPPELVDDAVAECKKTMLNKANKAFPDAVRQLMMALTNVGVNAAMIAEYLGHPADQMVPDEFVGLKGVLQQIKDGAKVSEFFGAKAAENGGGSRLDTLEKTIAKTGKAAETTKFAQPTEHELFGSEPDKGKGKDDPALTAARHLIKQFIEVETATELQALVTLKNVVADRAKLAKERPDLAAEVTAAMDKAAARVARG